MLSIAEFPKHEAVKESGVDWLGRIPSDWNVKPGMVAFTESKRDNRGMKESRVLSLSYGRIIVKPEEKLVGLVPESFETYQLVDPDDIIVRCTDLQNDQTSLRTGLAKDKGIITSAYLNLKVNHGYDARYMHYYLHALDTSKVLYKFGTGLRQNLGYNDFKRLPVIDIPIEWQVDIAKFLDKKTTQVDEAIAIKEQQIALLKERKQIIIQKAVTQGLDPTVPMKDSGVDWIGEIPAHWEFSKLKYYIDILSGYAFKSDSYSLGSDDVALLRGINVSPNAIRWDETVYWPEVKLKGFDRYLLQEGDLVIAMDRPWVSGGVRVAEVTVNDLPSLLLQRVGRIRGKSGLLTRYAQLLLSTNLFLYYFEPMLTGISVPHISQEQIESFEIPVPSIDEQNRILKHVESESKNIDRALSTQQVQIEKLKEYKTTMINSSVTGKIRITPDMVEA